MTSKSSRKPAVKIQWWVAEALKSTDARVIGVTAGLASGKTHGACQWHYRRCRQNKKSPFSFVCMPTFQKIHDAAIPTFRKVFETLGMVESVHYEVLKSPYPRITFADTKQEIHFLSGQNPERMVAVEYSHGFISEAGTQDKAVFERLQQRRRCPLASIRQTLIEGVPEGTVGWYPELFDDEQGADWVEYAPREYVNEARKYKRFRVSTIDNPYIQPEYAEELRDIYRNSPAHVESYIEGRFRDLSSGGCYTNYKPALHDIPDREPTPYRDIYLSFDFNANPLAWISFQKDHWEEYDSRREVMIAVHNADAGAHTLEDAAVEFAAKHPRERFAKTLIRLFGDSSGHAQSHKTRFTDYEALRHYLNALGYERVTVEAIRSNPLETESVDALNRWFLENYHYICKRCTQYKRSLVSTKWKEGVKKIEKKPGETHTHHGDAAKYLAFALREESGPKVASYNF